MMADSLEALARQWRTKAATLRGLGAEQQAVSFEHCATDLEEAMQEHELEELTLEEAVLESGYSYSALQKKVASGDLPNAEGKHRPRVRRGDLPRKAGRLIGGRSFGGSVPKVRRIRSTVDRLAGPL